MKLLVMQLSPPSRHSIPFWAKYSEHHVLKRPQFIEWCLLGCYAMWLLWFLQEPHGVTSQKTPFCIVTAVKTSSLTLSLCSSLTVRDHVSHPGKIIVLYILTFTFLDSR
jgi:hypothetical protein